MSLPAEQPNEKDAFEQASTGHTQATIIAQKAFENGWIDLLRNSIVDSQE